MTSILKQDHMINNNNINNYSFETKQKQREVQSCGVVSISCQV